MAKVGSGKFETVPAVPAQPERQVEIDKTICDMCGADIEGPGNYHVYSVENVTVSLEVGTDYPGDYHTETEEYDVCRSCFENKLVPFIKAGGKTDP